MTPEYAIANLRATATAGQCNNPFFRQSQLRSLYDVFIQNAIVLQDAIRKDTGVKKGEAIIEVARALSIVKEHYNSIHADEELKNEQQISKGKNPECQREPVGLVYIEPHTKHTPFFAIVAPLSAAVASGNVVALKLENNLKDLSLLLRLILPQALASDNFNFLSEAPPANVLHNYIQVLQDPENEPGHSRPATLQLITLHQRVVAVVDRTANLSAAAESLVTARFAFSGTSPYAPDIILVNEFVAKEFFDHVLRASIPYTTNSPSSSANPKNGVKRIPKDRIGNSLDHLDSAPHWVVNTLTKGDQGAVIELINESGNNKGLPETLTAPIIAMSQITSLDHAIDLLSRSGRLRAAYHFADPTSANYLNQFISSDVTFINHVPISLLLGPAAPASCPFDLKKRYTIEHFTRAAPAFSSPPNDQSALIKALGGHDDTAQALLGAALQGIKPENRPEWVARGFFEQGIFIGLAVYGIPFLGCVGASLFYAARFGLRTWAVR